LEVKEFYLVHNVVIRRPKIDDLEGLNQFFRIVITDTFDLKVMEKADVFL
jgi:hypothetical protein